MTMPMTQRALGVLTLGMATSHMPHAASLLSSPMGKVILAVSGLIIIINKDGNAEFDRAMLEALGMDGFDAATPWYDGPVRFDDVGMQRVIQAVGASGESLMAVALNDSTTDLLIDDFERYGVLLAMKRDGNDMPVRDKGPLFTVYPYDSKPELRSQKFYARSAWQVAKLRE